MTNNIHKQIFTSQEIVNIFDAKLEIERQVSNTIKLLDDIFNFSYFFVSGGCVASLLQGDKPKDWDFYCYREDDLNAVKDFLINHTAFVAEYDEKYRQFDDRDGKLITENAITLVNGTQIITREFGTEHEIRKSFDFVHCTPYYDIGLKTLFISRKQYDACVYKRLIVNNDKSVNSYRIEKFKQRGYTL